MKRTMIMVSLALLALSLFAATSAFSRAKPLKAYLTGAKIAVVEGRPNEALVLLDSISINYGPVPQALALAYNVYVDKFDGAPGINEKRPMMEKIVTYVDSLHYACQSPEIDKDYKHDCDELTEKADSTLVKYWREYFNDGVGLLSNIENLSQGLQNETDSSRRAYTEKEIQRYIDSVISVMSMPIMIDSTDHRPYLAIGNAYEKQGNYEKAVEWMERGLSMTTDSTNILLPLAFNYIKLDEYCKAIPFYQAYIKDNPEDVSNLFNLSICYNNCGLQPEHADMLDSAMATYRTILALQPQNLNALTNAGRYFIIKAQKVSDSATYYRKQEDMETAAKFDSKRREMFDSARTYYNLAFQAKPDDAYIAEQFAFTSALLQDCPSAIEGYKQVVELQPDNVDAWIGLGDCYLSLAKFTEATDAYEHVAKLKPDDARVWENLEALYEENNQPEKAAEAKAKLKEIRGS